MSSVLSSWPFIAVIVSICTAIGIVQGIIFWRVQQRWFARHFGDAAVRTDILTRRVHSLSTAVENLLHSPGSRGKNPAQHTRTTSRSPHQGLGPSNDAGDGIVPQAEPHEWYPSDDEPAANQPPPTSNPSYGELTELSLHPADRARFVTGAPDDATLMEQRGRRP